MESGFKLEEEVGRPPLPEQIDLNPAANPGRALLYTPNCSKFLEGCERIALRVVVRAFCFWFYTAAAPVAAGMACPCTENGHHVPSHIICAERHTVRPVNVSQTRHRSTANISDNSGSQRKGK